MDRAEKFLLRLSYLFQIGFEDHLIILSRIVFIYFLFARAILPGLCYLSVFFNGSDIAHRVRVILAGLSVYPALTGDIASALTVDFWYKIIVH